MQKLQPVARRRNLAEQGGLQPKHRGRGGPDCQQNNLAPNVVTNLDRLFVLVGGLINLVITAWLKKEVTGLAAGHRHRPCEQGGPCWLNEQQDVRDNKNDCAQQMQTLVNTAVMVVTVVVPTLRLELLQIAVHIDLENSGLGARGNEKGKITLASQCEIRMTAGFHISEQGCHQFVIKS